MTKEEEKIDCQLSRLSRDMIKQLTLTFSPDNINTLMLFLSSRFSTYIRKTFFFSFCEMKKHKNSSGDKIVLTSAHKMRRIEWVRERKIAKFVICLRKRHEFVTADLRDFHRTYFDISWYDNKDRNVRIDDEENSFKAD